MEGLCINCRWNDIIVLVFMTSVQFEQISGIYIFTPPSNMTVLRGDTARLKCLVAEQQFTDYVFWKKVTSNGFTDVISYNENVLLNRTSYLVDSAYTLTILSVDLDHEAWYECQAGMDRARAFITVTVMVANMSLTWSQEPPFQKNTFVNLTCTANHSRPPADIRWLHGDNDVTFLATACTTIYGDHGFGDVSSMIAVGISDDGIPYKCVASLPGSPVAKMEVVFPTVQAVISGADQMSFNYTSIHTLLYLMVLFAAKAQARLFHEPAQIFT